MLAGVEGGSEQIGGDQKHDEAHKAEAEEDEGNPLGDDLYIRQADAAGDEGDDQQDDGKAEHIMPLHASARVDL